MIYSRNGQAEFRFRKCFLKLRVSADLYEIFTDIVNSTWLLMIIYILENSAGVEWKKVDRVKSDCFVVHPYL